MNTPIIIISHLRVAAELASGPGHFPREFLNGFVDFIHNGLDVFFRQVHKLHGPVIDHIHQGFNAGPHTVHFCNGIGQIHNGVSRVDQVC